jgi:CRP-like cAMP-binding protein
MHADLFQGIAESTRWRILESGRVESYAPSDFIFRQGEPARRFYIMVEGRVRLSLGPGERMAHVAGDPGGEQNVYCLGGMRRPGQSVEI